MAFVVGTLIFLDSAGAAFSEMRVWITTKFDWTFMISMNIFVLFSLFVAYSKLGKVRLGGKDAKPRYGYPGWLAMLFAAGVVVPAIRELGEVRYQFDAPFVMDSSAATEAFGWSATPWDEVMAATMAPYGGAAADGATTKHAA